MMLLHLYPARDQCASHPVTECPRCFDCVWFQVEMRAADPENFSAAAAAVEAACGDIPWITCERILTVPVWPVNRASEALANEVSSAAQLLGLEVVGSARGGGSDGNWLWSDYAVLDGLGPSGRHAHCGPAHSIDGTADATTATLEHADWSSFRVKAALLVHTIVRLSEKCAVRGSEQLHP